MNILFLTLGSFEKNSRGIYMDLLLELKNQGHNIYVISPLERRYKQKTRLESINGINILKINTLNIKKINKVEKMISTLTIEKIYINGIKRYYKDITFDLVIYTTPPITFAKVISFIKNRDKCKSYLLLKDIFPQNAVDLNMIKKNGLIYKFFRKKEISLYRQADYIGCMSKGNVDYLLKDNAYINQDKVEVNPNSIIPSNFIVNELKNVNKLRVKNKLPIEKIIVAYGGNLGKPQSIDFLIEILKDNKKNNNIFFFIAGSGTEYEKLKTAIATEKVENVVLQKYLPEEKYNEILKVCDVGLILLDKKFTIPNIPSRILSYMNVGIPVIAATDKNTDLGEIIQKGNFGFSCESGDLYSFNKLLNVFINDRNIMKKMGVNARAYLENNYTARYSADIILKHFKEENNV